MQGRSVAQMRGCREIAREVRAAAVVAAAGARAAGAAAEQCRDFRQEGVPVSQVRRGGRGVVEAGKRQGASQLGQVALPRAGRPHSNAVSLGAGALRNMTSRSGGGCLGCADRTLNACCEHREGNGWRVWRGAADVGRDSRAAVLCRGACGGSSGCVRLRWMGGPVRKEGLSDVGSTLCAEWRRAACWRLLPAHPRCERCRLPGCGGGQPPLLAGG